MAGPLSSWEQSGWNTEELLAGCRLVGGSLFHQVHGGRNRGVNFMYQLSWPTTARCLVKCQSRCCKKVFF